MKKALFRSLVISVFFASLTGLASAVISLMQVQTVIAQGSKVEYMEPGQEGYEIIQFNNEAISKKTKFEQFLHAFTHPQFWAFWFLSFAYIVIPVFLGCLSVIFWYNKRPVHD